MDVKLIWHYTNGIKLDLILNDGYIEATHHSITSEVNPVVWLSSNQDWEPSATKGGFTAAGDLIEATQEEMIEVHGGYVRIGVRPDLRGIRPWKEYKKITGMQKCLSKHLEKSFYSIGANPKGWFARFEPIHRQDWVKVQVSIGNGWLEIPFSDNIILGQVNERTAGDNPETKELE